MRVLVVAVVLGVWLGALPVAAAAEPYSVDVTVTPLDGTDYLQRQVITFDSGGRTAWTWPVPTNATFVRATQDGASLSATVTGGEVKVTTNARGTTRLMMEFRAAMTGTAPYQVLDAAIPALDGSLTSAHVELPAGWTWIGWRGGSNGDLATDGHYRATGPSYAAFVVLPPGTDDGGNTGGTSGRVVVREATATVEPTATRVKLRVTYDTDVYGAAWTLLMPEDVSGVAISTPVGPVQHSLVGTELTTTLPYPFAYHLGARSFTIDYMLPAASSYAGEFVRVNVTLAAGADDYVTLNLTVPSDHLVTGARLNGAFETEPLHYVAQGPLTASVSLLPPPRAGATRFHEGAYIVQVEDALAAPARAAARASTDALAAATGFLGGHAGIAPFATVYTDAPVFDWEAGFYSPGYDTIAIRASSLRGESNETSRLDRVKTLVHESAHGLLDRKLPEKPGGVSFLDEGIARLAETHVELASPDGVFDCQESARSTACTRHSARPEAGAVQDWHASGAPAPLDWATSEGDPTLRGFYYDYAGLVFHAYERRAAAGSLEAVIERLVSAQDLEKTAFLNALVEALDVQAPDLSTAAILYPGRDVSTLSASHFTACMAPMVAPHYPFETAPTRPSSGCGTIDSVSGNGGDAPPATPNTPPAPPTGSGDALPPAPDPVAEPSGTDNGGAAPGAVDRPGGQAPIPFPAALAVVGILAAAWTRRLVTRGR